MKLLEQLKTLGRQRQRTLYRLCLYEDGRGEAEFIAPNPWECLLIRWERPEEIEEFLTAQDAVELFADRAVIRKKCTRCLLHERPLGPDNR